MKSWFELVDPGRILYLGFITGYAVRGLFSTCNAAARLKEQLRRSGPTIVDDDEKLEERMSDPGRERKCQITAIGGLRRLASGNQQKKRPWSNNEKDGLVAIMFKAKNWDRRFSSKANV